MGGREGEREGRREGGRVGGSGKGKVQCRREGGRVQGNYCKRGSHVATVTNSLGISNRSEEHLFLDHFNDAVFVHDPQPLQLDVLMNLRLRSSYSCHVL